MTVVEALALPPAPVQVSMKVVVLASAPLDCEPFVALVPLHPPEAVQLVALVDDQASVAD